MCCAGWDGFWAQLGCTPPWFVGEEATALCGEKIEGQEGVDLLGFMDKTSYQVARLAWPLLKSVSVTHLQDVLTDFASMSDKIVDRNKLTNYRFLSWARPGVSPTHPVQYQAGSRTGSTASQVPGACGQLPWAQKRVRPLPKAPSKCGRLPTAQE